MTELTKLERLQKEVVDARAAKAAAEDDYCYNYPTFEEACHELEDAKYLLEKYLKEQDNERY